MTVFNQTVEDPTLYAYRLATMEMNKINKCDKIPAAGQTVTITINNQSFTGIVTLVEDGGYVVIYSSDGERIEFETVNIQ